MHILHLIGNFTRNVKSAKCFPLVWAVVPISAWTETSSAIISSLECRNTLSAAQRPCSAGPGRLLKSLCNYIGSSIFLNCQYNIKFYGRRLHYGSFGYSARTHLCRRCKLSCEVFLREHNMFFFRRQILSF